MSTRVLSQLKFALALAAISLSSVHSASAQSATQIAQLTVTPSIAGLSANFGIPAISGDGNTIDVAAPNISQGIIYIYEKPSTGWANATQAAAIFWGNGCQLGGNIVTNYDGSVIAVRNGTDCSGGGASGFEINVVVRPEGGWQNGNQPFATLSGKDCYVGDGQIGISPSGNTIVTTCVSAHRSALLVYHMPAGGWSGTVNPTHVRSLPSVGFGVAITENFVAVSYAASISVFARTDKGLGKQVGALTNSDGYPLGGPLFMNDSNIFAGGQNPTTFVSKVYVFDIPSAGSPTTEIAQLSVGSASTVIDANSGGNLFLSATFSDEVSWFIEPHSGWQTTSQPNLTITSSGQNPECFGGFSALSGNTAVIGGPCANERDGEAFVFQLNP